MAVIYWSTGQTVCLMYIYIYSANLHSVGITYLQVSHLKILRYARRLYVLRFFLKTNSDYSLLQHQVVGFHSRDGWRVFTVQK